MDLKCGQTIYILKRAIVICEGLSMDLKCGQTIYILKRAIVICEGLSKLCVLSKGPPFSLFDVFLQPKKVQEFDAPLVVCPLRWFICLFGHGCFHFVPCVTPFLGALVFFL
jgi:hypothetical protein